MESIPEDNQLTFLEERESLQKEFNERLSESNRIESNQASFPTGPQKKIKKGIFLSYSPDASYIERAFINDLVRQLKENNLADDIWFDKDEQCIDNPIWFSQRMDAVERCQAAILVLSDQYFLCPVTIYELRTLIERRLADNKSVRIFCVKYSELIETNIPEQLASQVHHDDIVDLTSYEALRLSIPEKTSTVIGQFMELLDKFAVINTPLNVSSDNEAEFNGGYKIKKMCNWNVSDVQEWLFYLQVKEFYRQSLAEAMVDGFLLISVTDIDMAEYLGVDSKVVRKKIIQHIINQLDKEHKMTENWHLRARALRSRPNTVYLIYDPADVRLAQTFKQDLIKKGLQVIHHNKLGQSKEEFLRLNGPYMASSMYVLLVLTNHSSGSPFVFHEILFADWLGKKIVVALFRNDWSNLRAALKAVTGQCLAVDFERNLYTDAMDILEHRLKPMRNLPGLVLEQSYLNKMADGMRPLADMASFTSGNAAIIGFETKKSQQLFISFHWDMQCKVEEIKAVLERVGYTCWSDEGAHMRGHSRHGNSRLSTSSSSLINNSTRLPSSQDRCGNVRSAIEQNMRQSSLLICCITPKYVQSDNCINDLKQAAMLNRPILALLLNFCSWPPEAALPSVKKILVKRVQHVIELYNDKLFKQNLTTLPQKVNKMLQDFESRPS